MDRKIVGFYNYTVVLTYLGMLFAFAGIMNTISHAYWNALMCLIMAGICDMFDGAVASTRKRTECEKNFGIQIDSLSDLVSFGVLPAIFVYILMEEQLYVGMIAAAYLLCALIRLAYYNVLEQNRQREMSEEDAGENKTYLGLPVTTIAIFLPAVFIFYENNVWKNKSCFLIMLIITAIGFVTPVEIQKPKKLVKACLILIGVIEVWAVVHFLRGGMV